MKIKLNLAEAPYPDFAKDFPHWLRLLGEKDPAVNRERQQVANWIADQIKAQLPAPEEPEPIGTIIGNFATGEKWVKCSNNRWSDGSQILTWREFVDAFGEELGLE